MKYQAKNYEKLLGLEGFTDELFKNHFVLYQGYVANTNKLADLLKQEEPGTPEYAELKRRFGWELNGMRLHELYFENMKKNSSEINEELKKKIEENFGSFEEWEKNFKTTASMRGIGWVILYKDGDNLFNTWINEHDLGHLAGATPLLVIDVFEHAYMPDYGLKRADYIEAFFKIIDWQAVAGRL
jgi:Fe-Mn family superoxide dismutase